MKFLVAYFVKIINYTDIIHGRLISETVLITTSKCLFCIVILVESQLSIKLMLFSNLFITQDDNADAVTCLN